MIARHIPSRRALLRFAGSAATAAAVGRLGSVNAFAQTASDYKALVCIFMAGGSDSHNMLVPQSTTAYAAYKSLRKGLALPDGNAKLIPIAAKDGTPYALNDGLTAIAPLWGQGKLAAVANVGMLVKPTTRAQYLAASVPLPSNLFSHADQVIAMQAGNPYGSGGTGWAGRVADAVQPLNATAAFPPSFSMSGASLFCTGNVIQSASLYPGFDLSLNGMSSWPASAAAAKQQALQEIIAFDSGMAMVQAANKVRSDALALNKMLKGAGTAAPIATVFPGTNIGQQLKQVAQIIALRGSTGISRQVFFCALGGFDTHSSQSWAQWDLFGQIATALKAFSDATIEMGIADKVTAFTESDFGRTLDPNSALGTDHGWGSHHLVLGGAVRGGDVYGTFPFPALGGADDANSRGVLIPTTSLDQYAGTLAKWFGVDTQAMTQVFPNLANFPTADLGFMG
jgi:uncharacterized protein (DUF1501 family)